MTAQGPRKGESSLRSMRHGFRTQPARLVRGSSRRIMTMRFQPANIRVINRRVCSSAVIGPAVQNRESGEHEWPETTTPRLRRPNQAEGQRGTKPTVSFPFGIPILPSTRSELTSRNVFPPSRPSISSSMPGPCSPSRVRFAAPKPGAPLTPPRGPGETIIATGGSGGNTRRPLSKGKGRLPSCGGKPALNPNPSNYEGLDRSLHIRTGTARLTATGGDSRRCW